MIILYHKDKFVSGRHALKSNLCKEQGIKLLHIREDLWLNNKIRMKKVVEIFLELNATKMNSNI